MTHTRPLRSWARLTAPGIPAFAVIRRPLNIGFDATLAVGALYPAPEPGNFGQARRTRQLYQQRRIAPVETLASERSPASVAAEEDHSEDAALLPAESTAIASELIDDEDSGNSDSPVEASHKTADHEDNVRHHKNKKGNRSHGI